MWQFLQNVRSTPRWTIPNHVPAKWIQEWTQWKCIKILFTLQIPLSFPPPFPSFSTDFPAVLRLDSPCTGTDRRCTGAGTFGTVAWSRCSGHRHRRPLFFQLRLERLGVTLSGRGTTHGFAGFFAQRCPTTAGTRRRFLTLPKKQPRAKKVGFRPWTVELHFGLGRYLSYTNRLLKVKPLDSIQIIPHHSFLPKPHQIPMKKKTSQIHQNIGA